MDMVGGIPTPLKNMSSSIGMIIPDIWEKNVPNHQPEYIKLRDDRDGAFSKF